LNEQEMLRAVTSTRTPHTCTRRAPASRYSAPEWTAQSACGRRFPRDAPPGLRCKVAAVSFLPSAAGIAVAAAEEQE